LKIFSCEALQKPKLSRLAIISKTFLISTRRTITTIVGLLITAGTIFDHQLKKKIKAEAATTSNLIEGLSESSDLHCTTYDLTVSINGKESGGADICIPSSLNVNNNGGHLPMRPVTSRTTKDLSKPTVGMKVETHLMKLLSRSRRRCFPCVLTHVKLRRHL
jgi:hypothetical protein